MAVRAECLRNRRESVCRYRENRSTTVVGVIRSIDQRLISNKRDALLLDPARIHNLYLELSINQLV